MATTVRIEFAVMNKRGTAYENMLSGVPVSATSLSVTGTATAGGSRPVVPAGVNYAIIIPLDGNVIVAPPGADPTATQTDGKLCLEGQETVIYVKPGQLLSLIELA